LQNFLRIFHRVPVTAFQAAKTPLHFKP
jgi:hypothetical protein